MAEVTVNEDLVYVPRWWICTECTYRTRNSEIKGGFCPNDKAPLARLTWRRHYDDANEASHRFARQVSELVDENRALVARNDETVKVNRSLHAQMVEAARLRGE